MAEIDPDKLVSMLEAMQQITVILVDLLSEEKPQIKEKLKERILALEKSTKHPERRVLYRSFLVALEPGMTGRKKGSPR